MTEVEELLVKLLSRRGEGLISGIVRSVDEKKRTLVLEREGHDDVLNVRLDAVCIGDNYATIVPLEGSAVVIGSIDNTDEYVVVATSQTKQIRIKIKELKIDIDKEGVGINNKGKDLMTVLEKLIDEIKTITVTTANGPSGIPINGAKFDGIKSDFKTILKTI